MIDIYWHKVLCGNVNNINGTCWFNTYTCVNVRLIYGTWNMFDVSMHTCLAHKWNIYGTWNKICYVNAHLPINWTCFTHTHDLLCEYIYLCKSTKSTRQAKYIVLCKTTKSKDMHNTTKYFILCQCMLTLIKVKTVIVTLCHMHTKLPILFLAHPMTLHIFQPKPNY